MKAKGNIGSAILGMYGAIRCGVLGGYNREQLRALFDLVFNEYEASEVAKRDADPAGDKRVEQEQSIEF